MLVKRESFEISIPSSFKFSWALRGDLFPQKDLSAKYKTERQIYLEHIADRWIQGLRIGKEFFEMFPQVFFYSQKGGRGSFKVAESCLGPCKQTPQCVTLFKYLWR